MQGLIKLGLRANGYRRHMIKIEARRCVSKNALINQARLEHLYNRMIGHVRDCVWIDEYSNDTKSKNIYANVNYV